MTTWPNPERRGVPLNPEVDGWHWVQCGKDAPCCAKWCVDDEGTEYWITAGDEEGWGARTAGRHWAYLGPVRTDADVQAAAKAARLKALEDAAGVCQRVADQTPEGDIQRCAGILALSIGALKEGGE